MDKTPRDAPWALLDDRGASPRAPTSRLYTGFVREHRCSDPALLEATWREAQASLRAGLHALLLADYEWGVRLLHAGAARLPADDTSSLRVLMFSNLARLSAHEVDTWLRRERDLPAAAGVMDLRPSVDEAAFTGAIERIHQAIRAGETYQVNYTYRLQGQAHGEPIDLYRRLRARQPVAYGAFIALPAAADGDVRHVLSCSPELFLRHEAGVLTARPMKGTASRIATPEGDSETARHLSIDIKNRAENLMIVDLLRNDLGRVAEVGSVRVPELFTIEPYATVFQMTSTVQARLRPELGFAEVLRAVFPCGSITGAPKHHTMELIADLESTPRGLYCGAIGWLDAPAAGARCGDFCLSVAIRTLTLGAPTQGLRPARLGVGAGIVLDSRAADEFDECRLKARFLTSVDPGFELFETMLCVPGEGVRHLDRHLARLARSAQVLGFAFDVSQARDAVRAHELAADGASPVAGIARAGEAVLLDEAEPADAPAPAGTGPAQTVPPRAATPAAARRLRLALAHDGSLRITATPLPPLPDGPVLLRLAEHRLQRANPLAAHKTTLRQHYDEGVQAAQRIDAFDSLFFDVDGRLVEGGRSSVFVRLDGRWCTPPVADGALPGVMRAILLQDPAWHAAERSLSRHDLPRAEALMVCNALRGPLPARLA